MPSRSLKDAAGEGGDGDSDIIVWRGARKGFVIKVMKGFLLLSFPFFYSRNIPTLISVSPGYEAFPLQPKCMDR